MESNQKDKKLEKAIDQRPNYFAGQYLLEDDFLLEQKYHIDRQRRHNRLLHVSGIAEGLKVSPDEDKKVKVSAGTAIDSQGRQIILPDDQFVELENVANKKPLEDGGYTLYIRYEEERREKQDSEEIMARRVQETPKFELSNEESKSTSPDVIPLAKLTIVGGEVENEENIDLSVRQYSGICLPTEDGKGVTLRSHDEENNRSHGDDNPNLAVLTGSLSISGTLAVKESIRVGENETGVTLRSQRLENQNLALLDGSLSISGTLAVKESIRVGENETGVTLRSQGEKHQKLAIMDGSLSITGTIEVIGESKLTGIVNAKGGLQVTTTGTENIAKFEQHGTGAGVIISGIKGKNNALQIESDTNEEATIKAMNKGTGDIASFHHLGTGGGVKIHGVRGNNHALYIYGNDTDKATLYVSNKGKGPTISAEREGEEGLAAYFKGEVKIDKDLTVENIEVKRITTRKRYPIGVKVIKFNEESETGKCVLYGDIYTEEIMKWKPEETNAEFIIYNFETKIYDTIKVKEENDVQEKLIDITIEKSIEVEIEREEPRRTEVRIVGWEMIFTIIADKYKRKGREIERTERNNYRIRVREIEIIWQII